MRQTVYSCCTFFGIVCKHPGQKVGEHLSFRRTGKTCTVTVRTEGEEDVVVEGFVPGTYSVFNLNQKLSKFFVGGISDDVQIPDSVKNLHFDGCIEEVEFSETPVGLWDFVRAENNFEGCAERNELQVPVPANVLKFSGSGYVIFPKKKYQFGSNTHVKLDIQTYAEEGLLFLIGKNNKFFALQLEEGHAVLKYNLGSGTVSIRSRKALNDGQWHTIEATRDENDGVLKIDKVEEEFAKNPGSDRILTTTNQMFVGGHPTKHNFPGVSSKGYEGCIKEMHISAELIDLNKNKEALGVVSGCPKSIARTVSFINDSAGYVGMPPADLEKVAELTFKFKTVQDSGLIFYAANEDQSNYLLIAVHNGALIMSSKPGGEIRTNPEVKYNDKEWHYVSATKALRQMRLDIDDINSVEIEVTEDAIVKTTTPLYFGGVPDGYTIESDALPSYPPFAGCLGDTTVNNKFQNFADTRDRKSVSFSTCPLADPYEEPVSPSVTEAGPRITDEPLSSTVPTTEEVDEQDTFAPYPEGPEPTPVGQCALPVPPRIDTSVKPGDGIRFGGTPFSTQEFVRRGSFMGSIVDDSVFALEFKTSITSASGLLFYVTGAKHKDFVGLIMQKGKILYLFNCGTGSANITSQNTYNDGEWHRVVFQRKGKEGILTIDDEEVVKGFSVGSASSVNVLAPFYVGGLEETAAREAKSNLGNVNIPFPGCIRNVEAQGELLTSKKPSVAQNVTGCSDKVEEGVYFSHEGGYMALYDKFNVGAKISILFDIKPRNLSGILMAVHGKKDYLILQMVDGRIVVSVDNGVGPIRTMYQSDDSHFLCDGNWHTVQVIKNSNIVSLSVDNEFVQPSIGVGGVKSTDTKDPLYIGGIPEASLSKKGVETREQFVGCMRFLEINQVPQSLAQSRVFGQVTLNTCPTI